MIKFLMKNIRIRRLVINDKLGFIISEFYGWF